MKKRGRFLGGMVMAMLFWGLTSPAHSFVLINEILADPPVGLAGDANRDGRVSTSEDEFVELYNNGQQTVDLAGWTLNDELRVRHVFPVNTVMPPESLLVIFGGGKPAITGSWQVATTGTLSLNNSGDTVKLFDSNKTLITQVAYGVEGDQGQSLVRSLEGTESSFILHKELAGADGKLYSAGFLISPPTPESAVLPEWPTWGYLLSGLPVLWRRKCVVELST